MYTTRTKIDSTGEVDWGTGLKIGNVEVLDYVGQNSGSRCRKRNWRLAALLTTHEARKEQLVVSNNEQGLVPRLYFYLLL
jgi:hypothetical protein